MRLCLFSSRRRNYLQPSTSYSEAALTDHDSPLRRLEHHFKPISENRLAVKARLLGIASLAGRAWNRLELFVEVRVLDGGGWFCRKGSGKLLSESKVSAVGENGIGGLSIGRIGRGRVGKEQFEQTFE